MRALVVSALLAGVIVLALWPRLPGFLHPPLCSTVDDGVAVKSFCISWDANAGTYETPPGGVPADFGQRTGPTLDPMVPAALIFLAITTLSWATIYVARRYRTASRLSTRGP